MEQVKGGFEDVCRRDVFPRCPELLEHLVVTRLPAISTTVAYWFWPSGVIPHCLTYFAPSGELVYFSGHPRSLGRPFRVVAPIIWVLFYNAVALCHYRVERRS